VKFKYFFNKKKSEKWIKKFKKYMGEKDYNLFAKNVKEINGIQVLIGFI
jgi:hypothetical protein